MNLRQLDKYPPGDITPEHTKREQRDGLHPDVVAAYRYVDRVLPTADYPGEVAWHGWAVREAFLAGCSHAAMTPNSVPIPRNADQAAGMAIVAKAWLKKHAPDRLKTTNASSAACETDHAMPATPHHPGD